MTIFKVGETYKTRDGTDVRILATDLKGDFPIVGVLNPRGTQNVLRWCADGTVADSHMPASPHPWDLILPTISRWLAIDAAMGWSGRPSAGVTVGDNDFLEVQLTGDGKFLRAIHHPKENL